MRSSRIKNFYSLSYEKKIEILKQFSGLTDDEIKILRFAPNKFENIEILIENPVGIFPLPLGISVNLRVNGKDYMVPMVTEESSVIAALSNGARFFREGDGIEAHSSPPIMIGQIFIRHIDDPVAAMSVLFSKESEIVEEANRGHNLLKRAGGGAIGVEVRDIKDVDGSTTLIVHLLVNVADAMGANIVNTMCERISPLIEKLLGKRATLKIISNYAEKRVVKVWGRTKVKNLGEDGCEIAKNIEAISHFGRADVYRAVTHNKGIMNGIEGVLIATAQDVRANEAAIHAYAARNGEYTALSKWRVRGGFLVGEMELPLQVGTIGGAVNIHPHAKVCLKILKVKGSQELARVIGAVGLVQNFSALYALATKGIQEGHMRLHAKNLAISAGARGEEVDIVAKRMINKAQFTVTFAEEILNEIRKSPSKNHD